MDWDTLTLSTTSTGTTATPSSPPAATPAVSPARSRPGPDRTASPSSRSRWRRRADATDAAKKTLVALQGGDADLLRDWHRLIDITLSALEESLELLGVRITREHDRGESFYRDRLPGVVDAFVRADLAEEDDGAIVVRFEDRKRPLLIRKSDGGFLYATTDLAAVRYRVHDLGATRLSSTSSTQRQRDHFRDIFDAARLIGWDRTPDGATADLRPHPVRRRPRAERQAAAQDAKPVENVTLDSLLSEAVARAAPTRSAPAPRIRTRRHTGSTDGRAGTRSVVAVGIGADQVRGPVERSRARLRLRASTG